MSASAREAAADEVRDIFGFTDEATETEQETVEQPEQEPQAEAEPEGLEASPLDPEIPDEIMQFIDTPDFEEEALAEVEDEDLTEYDDPRLHEERQKRIAAEKKAAHYETLRVKAEREKWVAEAEKFFPLADVNRIDANSRRGFLRAAKSDHELKKPFVEKAIELERQALAEERQRIRAEVEAEVQEAWGRPITSSQAPANEKEARRENDDIFRSKGLAAGIKDALQKGLDF